MTAVLQLAKGYSPAKLGDAVYVSKKLDGVPIRINMRYDGDEAGWWVDSVKSRQDKPVPSTEFIVRYLRKTVDSALPNGLKHTNHLTFVGEVTHEHYTDFKNVSGIVRRQEPQSGLILNLFDFDDGQGKPFAYRLEAMRTIFSLAGYRVNFVRVVPQYAIRKEHIERTFDEILDEHDEGGVIRDADDKWQPGKRTWGYQKYVIDPTIDLRLHSYEEAISKDGEPLDMVGRMNFWYKGRVIGVGPGKLDYTERKYLWEEFKRVTMGNADTAYYREGFGPMACIKHKRDPSYEDLRQPTFQHWRDDKDTPDA